MAWFQRANLAKSIGTNLSPKKQNVTINIMVEIVAIENASET